MCCDCLDDKIETTTTFTVDTGSELVVIRNAPCLECQSCGETFFSDAVSEKLESIYETIKKVSPLITIVDYQEVA